MFREVRHEQLLWHRPRREDFARVQQQERRASKKMQVRRFSSKNRIKTALMKSCYQCYHTLYMLYTLIKVRQ